MKPGKGRWQQRLKRAVCSRRSWLRGLSAAGAAGDARGCGRGGGGFLVNVWYRSGSGWGRQSGGADRGDHLFVRPRCHGPLDGCRSGGTGHRLRDHPLRRFRRLQRCWHRPEQPGVVSCRLARQAASTPGWQTARTPTPSRQCFAVGRRAQRAEQRGHRGGNQVKPSQSVTLAPGAANAYLAGTSIYYQTGTAGSFQLATR